MSEASRVAPTLRYSEAVFLARYLRTLVEWDARACVRIMLRGNSLGVFGAPPTGCVTFVAVPVQSDSMSQRETVDRIVSAGRLRDVLGDLSSPVDSRSLTIPDAVVGTGELALLPPFGGWELVARDSAQSAQHVVDEAIARFRDEVPDNGADRTQAQRFADQVWSNDAWHHIPVRALHTAYALGFLAKSDAVVNVARQPGWTRVSTAAGQVFVADGAANLSASLALFT